MYLEQLVWVGRYFNGAPVGVFCEFRVILNWCRSYSIMLRSFIHINCFWWDKRRIQENPLDRVATFLCFRTTNMLHNCCSYMCGNRYSKNPWMWNQGAVSCGNNVEEDITTLFIFLLRCLWVQYTLYGWHAHNNMLSGT